MLTFLKKTHCLLLTDIIQSFHLRIPALFVILLINNRLSLTANPKIYSCTHFNLTGFYSQALSFTLYAKQRLINLELFAEK